MQNPPLDSPHTSTLGSLAQLTASLAACRSLESLSALAEARLAPLFDADELVIDITSSDLRRPALIRIGVDETWAKAYNENFHRLNPAVSALRRLVAANQPAARRFSDLCREPLHETRFYREYMKPQRHMDPLVGVMSLEEAGSLAPVLTVLAVRREGKASFVESELSSLLLLLPAISWGAHCAMRVSDDWSKSVIKATFGLSPKLAEVALLISKGMSNEDLARELDTTVGTVKQYVHQVMQATGAGSRTDLCRMILR